MIVEAVNKVKQVMCMLWTIFALFIVWLILATVYQTELVEAFNYIANKIKKGNEHEQFRCKTRWYWCVSLGWIWINLQYYVHDFSWPCWCCI